MTHELKEIFAVTETGLLEGSHAVLATVVALEGSSYRRPGVRMLLLEDGRDFGAVSGGCVEREIRAQAASVFKTGQPRMMTYDGRYRLGCEGILHILLEPFRPSKGVRQAFERQLRERTPFSCESHYFPDVGSRSSMGSLLRLEAGTFPLYPGFSPGGEMRVFRQDLAPCMRLVILGGEHDAVTLSGMASNLGWEVVVVVAADMAKTRAHFPGAAELHAVIPEKWDAGFVDDRTAVLLMTHSYARDLAYLLQIASNKLPPVYLGVLGPANRRERLLDDLLERMPETDAALLDAIRGPAGIDIGAETPQEIALSILSEILSVFRKVVPLPLKDKQGAIHSKA